MKKSPVCWSLAKTFDALFGARSTNIWYVTPKFSCVSVPYGYLRWNRGEEVARLGRETRNQEFNFLFVRFFPFDSTKKIPLAASPSVPFPYQTYTFRLEIISRREYVNAESALPISPRHPIRGSISPMTICKKSKRLVVTIRLCFSGGKSSSNHFHLVPISLSSAFPNTIFQAPQGRKEVETRVSSVLLHTQHAFSFFADLGKWVELISLRKCVCVCSFKKHSKKKRG